MQKYINDFFNARIKFLNLVRQEEISALKFFYRNILTQSDMPNKLIFSVTFEHEICSTPSAKATLKVLYISQECTTQSSGFARGFGFDTESSAITECLSNCYPLLHKVLKLKSQGIEIPNVTIDPSCEPILGSAIGMNGIKELLLNLGYKCTFEEHLKNNNLYMFVLMK